LRIDNAFAIRLQLGTREEAIAQTSLERMQDGSLTLPLATDVRGEIVEIENPTERNNALVKQFLDLTAQKHADGKKGTQRSHAV
jgi:hypothetical protein